MDTDTITSGDPVVPLPPALALTLLEGIRRHGNLFFAANPSQVSFQQRIIYSLLISDQVSFYLPPSLTPFLSPAAMMDAASDGGYWGAVDASRKAVEAVSPSLERILNDPIVDDQAKGFFFSIIYRLSSDLFILETPVVVTVEGKQVEVRAASLRAYFTAAIASLIEPYPLVVTPSLSASSLFDSNAFAAETPESFYVHPKHPFVTLTYFITGIRKAIIEFPHVCILPPRVYYCGWWCSQ